MIETSFNIGLVEVESCTFSKNIFVTPFFGHHNVHSPLTKSKSGTNRSPHLFHLHHKLTKLHMFVQISCKIRFLYKNPMNFVLWLIWMILLELYIFNILNIRTDEFLKNDIHEFLSLIHKNCIILCKITSR
jgi:hypothetical protein